MKLTYDGKHAVISVRLPSGRFITTARGETIEVSAAEGTALTALPGWAPPAQASTVHPEED